MYILYGVNTVTLSLSCIVSFLGAEMESGEGREQLFYDLSPCVGGKRRLIRGGGSAARISIGTGPHDPGGGEAQLTASWDTAVIRPVFQPKLQSVVDRSDDLGVSAMVVETTRGGWIVPDPLSLIK